MQQSCTFFLAAPGRTAVLSNPGSQQTRDSVLRYSASELRSATNPLRSQTRRAESLRSRLCRGSTLRGLQFPRSAFGTSAEPSKPYGLVRLSVSCTSSPPHNSSPLRRPDSHASTSQPDCPNSTLLPEPEAPASPARTSSRPSPAAAYGLACSQSGRLCQLCYAQPPQTAVLPNGTFKQKTHSLQNTEPTAIGKPKTGR